MKHLLLMLVCLSSLPSLADGYIRGNTRVLQGSVETYVVEWPSWTSDHDRYATVTWNVMHGTLLSQDKGSATVQWDVSEDHLDLLGSLDVYEDLGGQGASISVETINTHAGESSFCSGVLGPAAIAVDFGRGGNPGPALPSGATTYGYEALCAISPNHYTLTNSSVNCRSPWHGITQDHTPGDTNGYFLMVDADSNPGEFYRTTVNGLTPAFRYEFSAWVGNLDRNGLYERPRIRFEVHGPSGFIATSGDLVIPPTSPFQWQKVGFMFDLPAGVSSVDIVMVNRNQSGSGNDLVIDDLSFAPCYPPVIASFENGPVVDREHACNSGAVSLYGRWPSTIPFTTPAYQWQWSPDGGESWLNVPGATSLASAHSQPSPGIHRYRLMSYEALNPSQQLVSNPLTFYVQRLVVEPRTHHLYSCNGGNTYGSLAAFYRLEFSDPVIQTSYAVRWSPATYLSNPNTSPTSILLPSLGASPPPNGPPVPAANHLYTVTVTDSVHGCTGSGQQTVAQHNPRKVAVPNAFTPNGDGLNDLFRPLNLDDYPGSRFFIYNRWGQAIFSSQGPTLLDYSWNGTFGGVPQGSGAYAWRIEMSDCFGNIINGSTGNNSPSGTVTLIR
ncbi:gliding motility-associated C-terminal domain-containing protein [Myxococcus sp. K38C18041901]|uniref:gliding motility-associated C-terminal domain-containing protein n=1 Tax=Myxococcus guangdongensis TaxID=2906760 RepID=UPI0020A7BFA9|nr:gliding motility-associated C-terminal domain-containing protein [Myxococcus guangdongensis]MCP3058775.1 gliding motility-associated C-terminal domain-containing protein [Myxococcus guangdongensis]